MTANPPEESRRGLDDWGKLPRPLAPYAGRRPDAPAWFERAMAVPSTQGSVPCEGAAIETLCWGDPKHPPLLLLHGSMAHARWWAAVAPLLSLDHYVVALSFSGMGGSDWRPAYSVAQMAREALAVAEAMDLFVGAAKPILIAHSFGSKAAARVTGERGDRFAGTIFVDSFMVPETEAIGTAPPYRARFYDSEAAALARFRLSPDQPGGEPYILDAIARAGLIQRDGRWTWRFDPDFFSKLTFEAAWDHVLRARCPMAFVRGEHSPVATRVDFALQRRHLRLDSLFVEIPDSYHHIMLDQPPALTSALRAILDVWRTP